MRGKSASPGDTNVAVNGYHYTRTKSRWRLTHHLLAEEKLGRPIADDEQVYFIDGNRKNLVKENIGVRKKVRNNNRRKHQLRARLEQLIAEYLENDPANIDDLQELVDSFKDEPVTVTESSSSELV